MANKKKPDGFDPMQFLGRDLKSIMAMVEIAPVSNIMNFRMGGLNALLQVIDQVVYPARNMPYIVTFRTGNTMMPPPIPPAVIFVTPMANGQLGNLTLENSIPMDLSAHDEFTTIVAPGQEWRAGSTTLNAILTVITRSMELTSPNKR